MRRGLLSWDQDEVPRAVLDARLERCRRAMVAADLPCLVIYTNFPRPAAASWLTHFVPYWSQGLLAVFADRPPALMISLSKRVSDWIASTAHVGDIICTPNPGLEVAKMFAENCPGAARIGILELDAFPGGLSRQLLEGLPGVAAIDAAPMFAEMRSPADATEIALAERAAGIAARALDAGIAAADGTTGPMVAAIEASARLAGAEEVLIRVAPNLNLEHRMMRIEGAWALGEHYATQVSVAYKGQWVRVGRSAARAGDAPDGWSGALDDFVAGLRADETPNSGGSWVIEGCTGTRPLSVLSTDERPGDGGLAPGAVRNLTIRRDIAGGPWLASTPILLGGTPGATARMLTS